MWTMVKPGTIEELERQVKMLKEQVRVGDESSHYHMMENKKIRGGLATAIQALKSYQYGNSSPDLAAEVVVKLEAL